MRTTIAIATVIMMSAAAYAQAPAAAGDTSVPPSAGGASDAQPTNANGTASAGASRTGVDAPQFIENAGFSGAFEIESSKLALEKGTRDDVKMFAQHMIDAHTKASTELENAVAASGIEIGVPDVLDSPHAEMIKSLQASANFDADYLNMQYQAHQDAISLFKSYAEGGEAGPIKDYAAATLPELNNHLEMLPKDAMPQ